MAFLVVGCVPRGLVIVATISIAIGVIMVATGRDQTIARALLVNGILSAIGYLVIGWRQHRP